MKNKNRFGLGGLVAVATLIAALFTNVNAVAADVTAKGGATKLMSLKTVSDVEAIKTGDVVVMACAKCDTITETRVQHSPKGTAGTTATEAKVHTCPGCSSKWEVDGHGKAKTEKMVHVCSHCGAKGAVCAVRKASSETK